MFGSGKGSVSIPAPCELASIAGSWRPAATRKYTPGALWKPLLLVHAHPLCFAETFELDLEEDNEKLWQAADSQRLGTPATRTRQTKCLLNTIFTLATPSTTHTLTSHARNSRNSNQHVTARGASASTANDMDVSR